MGFFSGEYSAKIDAKGRLFLPSRVKALLCLPQDASASFPELFLYQETEPCLSLYTKQVYDPYQRKVSALSAFNSADRKLLRAFFSRVRTVALDALGRLLLPKPFLLHANLSREGLIVGVGDFIEIWNPENYRKEYLSNSEDYERFTNEMKNESSKDSP